MLTFAFAETVKVSAICIDHLEQFHANFITFDSTDDPWYSTPIVPQGATVTESISSATSCNSMRLLVCTRACEPGQSSGLNGVRSILRRVNTSDASTRIPGTVRFDADEVSARSAPAGGLLDTDFYDQPGEVMHKCSRAFGEKLLDMLEIRVGDDEHPGSSILGTMIYAAGVAHAIQGASSLQLDSVAP